MADRNVSTCLNRMKIRGRGSSALQITKIQNRGFTMAGQYVKLYYASLPHDQKHVVLPTLGRPGPLSTIFKAL